MEDLRQTLYGVQKRISELYFDLAAGRVKNVKEVSSLRRQAARINTILGERKRT